jgi:hypothetical protein
MITISIQEIRESLAKDDAEGLDGPALYEIMLNGCAGYSNHSSEDCIEWFLWKGRLLNFDLDDSDKPVKVARIVDSNRMELGVVEQYCNELAFRDQYGNSIFD